MESIGHALVVAKQTQSALVQKLTIIPHISEALNNTMQVEEGNIYRYANWKKHVLFLSDQDILTALYSSHVKLPDSPWYDLSDRVLVFHNARTLEGSFNLEWARENPVIIIAEKANRRIPIILTFGERSINNAMAVR